MTKGLSTHAFGILRSLALHPIPSMEINAGVSNKFLKDGFATEVQLRSPYKKHKGGTCAHLQITMRGFCLARGLPIVKPDSPQTEGT